MTNDASGLSLKFEMQLEDTNRNNLAMREMLRCLDMSQPSRVRLPILEQLCSAKELLSGEPNPPLKTLPPAISEPEKSPLAEIQPQTVRS